MSCGCIISFDISRLDPRASAWQPRKEKGEEDEVEREETKEEKGKCEEGIIKREKMKREER